MTCKSLNVIYILLCTNCKKFYVGQTENLRKRVTLHREQICHENYRLLNVSHHMANCNDGNFGVFPIYKFSGNVNRLQREQKEGVIIKLLLPELNSN